MKNLTILAIHATRPNNARESTAVNIHNSKRDDFVSSCISSYFLP